MEVGSARGAVEVNKRQGAENSGSVAVSKVTMQAVKVANMTAAARGGGRGG